ncbi:MAG: hypothetical protein J6W03_04390 [Bacteroidaceae bacterium]|nr:hypothetical protein [Bacteroidaceae bacterium]
MYRKLATLILLMLTGMCAYAQSSGTKQVYKAIKDTYEAQADSMTRAFINTFMIKTRGIFNVEYNHYGDNIYWQQAHAIDVVIYDYERIKGINTSRASTYLGYIKLWYKNKGNNYAGAPAASSNTPDTINGYKMFENPYTDDMCWITLTLLHIGEATGNNAYSIVARKVFDNYIITRASEDASSEGLSLPWNNSAGSGPNACTQSPATLIAGKLYQKFGDAKYLDYAKKLYKYAAKHLVKSDGRVEEPPLTYTQGTFAEACRILYHITDEKTSIKNKYRTLAYTYIKYAFGEDANGNPTNRCNNGDNILRHEGTNADQSLFKAVFIPYAVNFVLDEQMIQATNQPYRRNILEYILKNTKVMWQNLNLTRFPKVFCNYDWCSPYTGSDSEASMGAMCSGSSLMENTARMCRTIVDRYELGTLLTTCNKYAVDPEYAEEDVFAAFESAKQVAAEIMANPGDYTILEFHQAKENLEATYQAVQDFATFIEKVQVSESFARDGVYDLNGRKLTRENQGSAKANLPRGIYVIGGRKVLIK